MPYNRPRATHWWDGVVTRHDQHKLACGRVQQPLRPLPESKNIFEVTCGQCKLEIHVKYRD